jgi:hypothetical protein
MMQVIVDFMMMIGWGAFFIGIASFFFMIYDLIAKSIYSNIYLKDTNRAAEVYTHLMEISDSAEAVIYGVIFSFGLLFGIYFSFI